MKLAKIFSKLGFSLMMIHSMVVVWMYQQHFEGSWGGFLLFLLDFPISLLSFAITEWESQWIFFGVVGSLWWYLVGTLIAIAAKRIGNAKQ